MKDKKMPITKNESFSKVDEKFYELKNNKKLALMPFIMAGDPNIEKTSEILLKLQENGADLIELGIPYSDPLADGPVIQVAASRALKSGTTPRKVITLLESLKGKLNIPVILFSYLNPLLCFGFEQFCEMAYRSGVSGLIIPDLPLEEAYKFSKIVSDHYMDLILLVAPTTPLERMKQISNHTKGFTYLVSVTGVTGERNKMENRVENLIAKLKDINTNPIAVGFGISTPEHVYKVRDWGADGVIIGSAFVKRISSSSEKDVVENVGEFCKDMRLASDKKNNT
ncbi:tryptophan synthase subunit alpha [Prochlorococcus sp. AH-736-K20]|nr:tryptophan synthase subunit alpha [Prochlorococcus sp. AH-736-K20]MDA9746097.1 tryptophan synthase subunit alpha [Prochlorococcus sp. AH-736-K20]